MIGKPQWFSRRKYTGWGFTPKTWQGWLYIFVMILPIVILTNLKISSTATFIFTIIWALIFVLDFIHIAFNLPKDEREKMHEAIAERNALWAILTILVIGVAYQAASGVVSTNKPEIDPVILIALVGGVIAKMISNLYLDRKD